MKILILVLSFILGLASGFKTFAASTCAQKIASIHGTQVFSKVINIKGKYSSASYLVEVHNVRTEYKDHSNSSATEVTLRSAYNKSIVLNKFEFKGSFRALDLQMNQKDIVRLAVTTQSDSELVDITVVTYADNKVLSKTAEQHRLVLNESADFIQFSDAHKFPDKNLILVGNTKTGEMVIVSPQQAGQLEINLNQTNKKSISLDDLHVFQQINLTENTVQIRAMLPNGLMATMFVVERTK